MFDLREELLHPVLSHFPIAMFILAFFTVITQLTLHKVKPETASAAGLISKFLLYGGAVTYLVTLFLGDTSLDIIKNDLCNLSLAYKHEQTAELAIPFFVLAILSEIGLTYIQGKSSAQKFWPILAISLFINLSIGNYFLIETAHLGGKLVYEEGAAVTREMGPCPKN